MRFGTFTFLATGCAIALGVSPALSQEAEPPELEEEVSQTANSAVTQARIDIARLDGQVEGLTLQLETERALSAKVLATIQTVLTVYTAGAALVAFLLAFFRLLESAGAYGAVSQPSSAGHVSGCCRQARGSCASKERARMGQTI